MGLGTIIGNAFRAFAALCGWGKQRDAENNAPTQQANAQAETIQADRAQAAKDVASSDLTQLEKDTAE